MDQTAAPINEHRFPCNTCGSDMRFDPGDDQLICDHCGNTEVVERRTTPAIREMDFRRALADDLDHLDMEEVRATTCPNCAAQVEFDPDVHATECPFCATPVVADTGINRQIKPKGVVPFILDEANARQAMTKWLGSLWFAPNGLQDYARKGRKLQGVYVPYWTYDAATKTVYAGERGTIYYVTKTVTRNGKRQQARVAKTRWKPVRGRVARNFDDVLVLASRSLPKPYTDALAPWQLGDLRPYSPEYLAGFRAEGYTVELDDGFVEARAFMDAMINRDIRFDIGGDKQRVHQAETDVRNITFKHILLPVWLAAYKYRGRTYRFVVNGQTGAVKGERPYSAMKIAIAAILGLCVALILGYFMAMQQ